MRFAVLFDEADDAGAGLPAPLRAVYGDWRLPAREPYVYVNFVTSRDGRVSFADEGHRGGGEVSAFDPADRWLMALLRARADAVLVGDGTLRAEPEHVWTAESVVSEPELAALRRAEGRAERPLQVVLSADGRLPEDAAILRDPGLRVIVVTPEPGAEEVDLARVVRDLGVRTLLCEGGPRVYGSLLRSGLAFDEFLTLSPLVLGDDGSAPRRPSLVEGVRFAPGRAPRSRLLSVRRAGDLLFLRSRYFA